MRLADTRGRGGRDFAYRLTIAPPRPDFTVFLNPANPNVPRGSRVPVTVTAFRHDGFDGPIHVKLTGLPAGVEAIDWRDPARVTRNVAITVSASEDAAAATSPFSVIADANVSDNGSADRVETVTRTADLERALPLVTVTTPPDVRVVSVEPKVIELEPGKRATVHAKIARGNGFTGRVPLNVLNLPFRVTVPNTGLNGILITEQQDGRDFIIEADPAAAPLEQTLYVTARAEVNSGEPSERASTPIILRILPAAHADGDADQRRLHSQKRTGPQLKPRILINQNSRVSYAKSLGQTGRTALASWISTTPGSRRPTRHTGRYGRYGRRASPEATPDAAPGTPPDAPLDLAAAPVREADLPWQPAPGAARRA